MSEKELCDSMMLPGQMLGNGTARVKTRKLEEPGPWMQGKGLAGHCRLESVLGTPPNPATAAPALQPP